MGQAKLFYAKKNHCHQHLPVADATGGCSWDGIHWSTEEELYIEGEFNIFLPEECTYLPNKGEYLEFTSQGQLIVHLSNDTRYFADSSFVISPLSAYFLEDE